MSTSSIDTDSSLWLYWFNGPFTLLLSIVGSLLNLLTIYVVSLYAQPKHLRRHRPTLQLSSYSILGTLRRKSFSVAAAATVRGKFIFVHNQQQPVVVTINSDDLVPAGEIMVKSQPKQAVQDPLSPKSPIRPVLKKCPTLTSPVPPSTPVSFCDDTCWTNPGTPTRKKGTSDYRLYRLGSTVSSVPSSPSSPGAGRLTLSRASSNCTSRPVSRRSSSRFRVYNFLLWMAMSDTLQLLCSQFMYAWPTLFPHVMAVLNTARLSYWLGNAAMMASVWLMLALTFDRYWTLNRRPFKLSGGAAMGNGRCGSKVRIHKMVAILYLLTLTAALPRLFEYRVECQGGLECNLQPSHLVQQAWYFASYRILGGMLLYAVVPYAFVFVLLCKIWTVLKKANQLKSARIQLRTARDRIAKLSGQYCPLRRFVRYQLHSDETTDSEIILMFLNLKFIISRLGPWLCDCVEFSQWWMISRQLDVNALKLMASVSNLLVVGAAGGNFFIFYIFSATFRRYLTADMEKS